MISRIAFATSILICANVTQAAMLPLANFAYDKLADCGSVYAEPLFPYGRTMNVRPCEPASERHYKPSFAGIGYSALDLESEICFVPDASFRLLDEIVGEILKRVGPQPLAKGTALRDTVLMVSRITGDVLAEKGFALHIPTDTLASALFPQNNKDEDPLFSIDCDTSSLILLTVAENLELDAALVEMRLGSTAGHNFVRWNLPNGASIDWDTNGRTQCSGPTNTAAYQGRSMSRDETLAYLTTIRAQDWDRRKETVRALSDYRRAIQLAPAHPVAFNNFVWIVATREFSGRENLKAEALGYAEVLVSIERGADNLDTAACIAAYVRDFGTAALLEREAITLAPDQNVFAERLRYFTGENPRDCTGVK